MPRFVPAAGLVFAAGLIAAAPPTPDELARDLGSPAYAVRERASKELWKLGAAARPALEAAAKSGDAEVSRRAADILEKFDWGVFPDTPADVLKLIREFRSGEEPKQTRAIDGLLALGDRGLDTLAVLLARDFDPARRSGLFAHVGKQTRRLVPAAVFDRQLDRAERLLEIAALGGTEPGWADYATFMHLRGRLREAAGRLEAHRKAGGPRGQSAGYALVFARHLAGDSRGAVRVAGSLPPEPLLHDLVTSVKEDAGMWVDLAAESAGVPDGLALFRQRMAGQAAAAAERVRAMKQASGGAAADPDAVHEAAVGLLLNGLTRDGIELFRTKQVRPDLLADLLTARLEFKDALDLIGRRAAATAGLVDPRHGQLYQFRRGRLLAQLGQTDAAVQVFNAAADGLRSRDQGMIVQLLRAEVRSGRLDLAAEHAGRFLDLFDRTDEGFYATPSPFELLFEEDAEAARGWWRGLRKFGTPKEAPGATMRRVRELLAGKATPARRTEADRAIALWEDQVKRADYPNQADLQLIAQARAAAARAAGDLAAAERQLAQASAAAEPADADDDAPRAGPKAWVYGTDERFRAWLDYADLLADRGQPREAADKYLEGWRRFPDNPILLYLSGRAILTAGDEAEGRRRIELAHWVPLGNARMRGRFLDELCSRGRLEDVRRERDLARKTVWYWEPSRGNVWNQVARACGVLKEFDAGAAATERYLNFILRTENVAFVEGTAYAAVPMAVTAFRARGLLAAGQVDAAVTAAKEHHAVLPGYTDLVTALVPELEKLGRRTDADGLFRAVWEVYRGVLKEYPQSAWAHGAAAALAAGCRRELDAALAHATKAVEAEPESKAFKEVLAEVRFRRGERAEAVKLMTELSAADPRNLLYRRLIERYRSGDLNSPVPAGPE